MLTVCEEMKSFGNHSSDCSPKQTSNISQYAVSKIIMQQETLEKAREFLLPLELYRSME